MKEKVLCGDNNSDGVQFIADSTLSSDLPPSSLSLWWGKVEETGTWKDQMFTRSIVRKQPVQDEKAISFQGHRAS